LARPTAIKPNIKNTPCIEALDIILTPMGLRYELRGDDKAVLVKR